MKFHFPRLFGSHFKDIKKIMGEECVLVPKEMKAITGTRKAPDCGVCYDYEVYEKYAEENKQGQNWRVFCRTEQSYAGLRAKQPQEFCPASIYEAMPTSLTVNAVPALRLINLNLQPLLPFYQLEKDSAVDRAWVITLAQAMVGFNLLRGQRFLKDCFHFAEDDAEGSLVPLLGGYDEEGMLLYRLDACHKPLLVREDATSSGHKGEIGTIICRVPQSISKKKNKAAREI